MYRALLDRAETVLKGSVAVRRLSPQLIPGVYGFAVGQDKDHLGIAFDIDEQRGVGRAVGEAFERYAYLRARNSLTLVGHDEAVASGHEMLDIETVARPTLDDGHPLSARFAWSAPSSLWVAATDASQSDPVLIPAELAVSMTDPSRPILRPHTTVGTALAPDAKSAAARARLEIEERHVLALALAAETVMTSFAHGDLERSPAVRLVIQAGARLWAGYLVTSASTTVAYCFVELEHGAITLFAGGASAHPDRDAALEAATLEAVQNLHVELQHVFRSDTRDSPHHRMLTERARFWTSVNPDVRDGFLCKLIERQNAGRGHPQVPAPLGRMFTIDITPRGLVGVASVQRCIVPSAHMLPVTDISAAGPNGSQIPHPFF